jgi:hypothetical protein
LNIRPLATPYFKLIAKLAPKKPPTAADPVKLEQNCIKRRNNILIIFYKIIKAPPKYIKPIIGIILLATDAILLFHQ